MFSSYTLKWSRDVEVHYVGHRNLFQSFFGNPSYTCCFFKRTFFIILIKTVDTCQQCWVIWFSWQIKYYLDEGQMYHHRWSVSIDELERAIQEATYPYSQPKVVPRVLAVINPGNPTGKCVAMIHTLLHQFLVWLRYKGYV